MGMLRNWILTRAHRQMFLSLPMRVCFGLLLLRHAEQVLFNFFFQLLNPFTLLYEKGTERNVLLTVECISSMASMHPVLSWLLITKLDRSGNNNNDKNQGSHSAVNMISRWPCLRPYPKKLISKPVFLDKNYVSLYLVSFLLFVTRDACVTVVTLCNKIPGLRR